MSNTEALHEAAQAVLDRWDSPQWEWAKHSPTADLMHALRAALAQPATDDRWNEGFKHGQWLAKHSAPVVERADSATPVVERGAGNVSDNAAPVAHAEPASEPAPAPRLRWAEAPRRTEWGAGMMEALIALGVDETLRLYAHRDAVPMVDALLSAQPAPARMIACVCGEPGAPGIIHRSGSPCYVREPAPARVPLTNKQRTAGASAWAAAWADPDLSPADKAAAVYMAMLTAADITAKEAP